MAGGSINSNAFARQTDASVFHHGKCSGCSCEGRGWTGELHVLILHTDFVSVSSGENWGHSHGSRDALREHRNSGVERQFGVARWRSREAGMFQAHLGPVAGPLGCILLRRRCRSATRLFSCSPDRCWTMPAADPVAYQRLRDADHAVGVANRCWGFQDEVGWLTENESRFLCLPRSRTARSDHCVAWRTNDAATVLQVPDEKQCGVIEFGYAATHASTLQRRI